MKMIIKILCKLGFHNWERVSYGGEYTNANGEACDLNVCKYCEVESFGIIET